MENLLDQSRAPIYEALENFRHMRVVPFDVPGHKHGRGNPELTAFLGEQCVGIDVNSMKPLDNLCHPVSVIRQAEELAADAFGAAHANGLLQLITHLDVGIVLLMPLHPGLGQQVITEQILKTSILRNGCAEVLTEGTEQAALEAVLRSIRLAVGEGMFHLLQIRFLSRSEQEQQVPVSLLAVGLCVTVVLCIIDAADILQKLGIHGAVLHTAKQISYIHFVSSCILDW